MKKIFAFAVMMAAVGMTSAQELENTQELAAEPELVVPQPAPVRFLVGLGLSAGGDKLASAKFTNGTTETLHAGGLVYLTAGVDYRILPAFSLQATVNYHVDNSTADNGDMKFDRIPLELLAYYQPAPAWRVGGGVRFTRNPKLSSSGVISGMDIKFDSTTSAVIEAEYFTSPKFGVKMRYVNEKFKARGYQEVDGSHVGVSANFYF